MYSYFYTVSLIQQVESYIVGGRVWQGSSPSGYPRIDARRWLRTLEACMSWWVDACVLRPLDRVFVRRSTKGGGVFSSAASKGFGTSLSLSSKSACLNVALHQIDWAVTIYSRYVSLLGTMGSRCLSFWALIIQITILVCLLYLLVSVRQRKCLL